MTHVPPATLDRLKTAAATAAALNEAIAGGDDREYIVDLSLNVCRDLQAAIKELGRAA